MLDRIQQIKHHYFLFKNSVKYEKGVRIERPENICVGSQLSIKYMARIRSRNKNAKIVIGNSVKIREFTEINSKGTLTVIDDFCFLAKNSWVGGSGSISIGRNSMIGIGSIIVASDHDYINIKTPYYDNSEIPKDIKIGEKVWIGAGVVVLGGTSIGSGSVISAGAVVKGVFPENSFIGGVRAEFKHKIERETNSS